MEWQRKDRPPAQDGEYLTWHKKIGHCIHGFRVGIGFGDDQVTHWMPLPSSPNDEETRR